MPFATFGPETIAVFIPIIIVLGGVLVAITAVIVNGRNKDLEHRERLIAMEKGLPLPDPPPVRARRPSYAGRRSSGLVMTGIGLGLLIALSYSEGFSEGLWGLIPMFIGVGLLIAAVLDKREYDRERQRQEGAGAPPSEI